MYILLFLILYIVRIQYMLGIYLETINNCLPWKMGCVHWALCGYMWQSQTSFPSFCLCSLNNKEYSFFFLSSWPWLLYCPSSSKIFTVFVSPLHMQLIHRTICIYFVCWNTFVYFCQYFLYVCILNVPIWVNGLVFLSIYSAYHRY